MRIVTVALLMVMLGWWTPASMAEQKTQYRGFTVPSLGDELKDARKVWNANQVRYMMCPVWKAKGAVGQFQATWQKMIDDLPAGLDRAKALGLAVVIDLHQIPNDHPKPGSMWDDEENLRILIECWRQIAEICKDRDQVIWYDLYNEPLERPALPSFAPKWPAWAQMTTDEIRKIDRRHPIVIEAGPGMLAWGFKDFPPINDPYLPVIYSVHMYQPLTYTHQGVGNNVIHGYPGEFPADSGGGWWDAKRLKAELQMAIDFQNKHNVRIYVGEFSAARWAPGAADYLRDCVELFESLGWDWNYHAFREAKVWSLEGPDAVDLYDKDGKYLRTDVAKPGEDAFYPKYATPEKQPLPVLKAPENLTERGRLIFQYMKRND